MIHKTLHRKLTIQKHEPHKKSGVHSDAPKRHVVLAQLGAPIVLNS
jgi:hypothetical protein